MGQRKIVALASGLCALVLLLMLADTRVARVSPARLPKDDVNSEENCAPFDSGTGQTRVPDNPGVPEANQGEEVQLVVRDLADGCEIRGVEFEITFDGGERGSDTVSETHHSSANGALSIPWQVKSLQVRSDEWQQGSRNLSSTLREGTVWLYRSVTIKGFVDGDGGTPDYSQTRVKAVLSGNPNATVAEPTPEPWNCLWWKRHSLVGQYAWTEVGNDGDFEIKAPRSRFLSIVAMSPGWRPAFVDVPLDSITADEARVIVHLHRAPRIRGVVTSEDGSPVGGASVLLYIHQSGPPDSMNVERLFHLPYAMSGGRRNSHTAEYTIKQSVRTDSEGNFFFDLPVEGTATVVIHAEGKSSQRLIAGNAIRSGESIEVLVTPDSSSRVQFLCEGEILSNRTVIAIDISENPQLSVEIPLDQKGETVGRWFEFGRRYWLVVENPPGARDVVSGSLDWDGQTSIEMTQLKRTK